MGAFSVLAKAAKSNAAYALKNPETEAQKQARLVAEQKLKDSLAADAAKVAAERNAYVANANKYGSVGESNGPAGKVSGPSPAPAPVAAPVVDNSAKIAEQNRILEQNRLAAQAEQARIAGIETTRLAEAKKLAQQKIDDEAKAKASAAARITVPFPVTAPTDVVKDPAYVKMQQDNLDLQKQFALAIQTQNAQNTLNQKDTQAALAGQQKALTGMSTDFSKALADTNANTAIQMNALGKTTQEISTALADSNANTAKQMNALGKTTQEISTALAESNAKTADQLAAMGKTSEEISATLKQSTDAITAQMASMGKTDAEITKALAQASDQMSAMGLNNKEMAAQIAANAVKAETNLKQAFVDQAAQAKAEQAAAQAEMDKQAAITTGKSFTAARESNKKSFEQAIAAQQSGAAGSSDLNAAYTAQENIGMLGAQKNQADQALIAQQATTAAGGIADIGSALSGVNQYLGQTVSNVGTQAAITTANTKMQGLSLSAQDQVNKIATDLTASGMAASDALTKAIDQYGAQVTSRINDANLRSAEGQALLKDYLTSVGLSNMDIQQHMARVLSGELSLADLKVALARSGNTRLATETGVEISSMQKDAATDAAWQAAIAAGVTSGINAISDRTAKKDIKEGGGRSFLDALTSYSYKYNDKGGELADGKENVGIMAQDLEKVRPELVKEVGGVKQIDYGRGFNSLLASMVEINDSVKQLETMFKKKKV